ncbi:MAG TPA: glycosyltransferase family 1 protein [Solirubrobacteraceae bacterium]|nr:glycosyltransferase family 1 protein [Solirubrobacteraceae bacterium]
MKLPRRVGINAIFLLPGMGGLDTYVRELVPELIHGAPGTSFTVYCSPTGEEHLRKTDWVDAVELVSPPLFGTRGLKAASEVTLLGLLAGRQVDLLHSVALTAPLWTQAVNVVTVADTTWLEGRPTDMTTRMWRVVVPAVARRADRVIAISENGARDIVRHLRVPRERLDVTVLGHRRHEGLEPVPEAEVRKRFGLGDSPLVLAVGTRKPHKNMLRLLEAMPEVLAAKPDARLVLAGNPTSHESELRASAGQLGLQDRVTFLSFVETDMLEGLYATSTCFVMPSLHEGFGLPLLEAMGRGLPVACSNVSALPEVAGEAALYFDPMDVHQIARALIKLLGDSALRHRLGAAGRARETRMTWQATAEATLASYARAWRERLVLPSG